MSQERNARRALQAPVSATLGPGISSATKSRAITSFWRVMSAEEAAATIHSKAIVSAKPGSDVQKFVSESLLYVKTWGQEAQADQVVRFDLAKREFAAFRKDVPYITTNATEDVAKSIWHDATVKSSSKKRCFGIGTGDIGKVNSMIRRVKAYKNPGSIPGSRITRFLRSSRGLCAMGGIVVTLALEGTSLGLAVKADGGKFRKHTTANLASLGAGVSVCTGVSAALAIAVPGIGTLTVAMIAGILAAIAGTGVSETILFFWGQPGQFAATKHSNSLEFEDLHELEFEDFSKQLVGEDNVIFTDEDLALDPDSFQVSGHKLEFIDDLNVDVDLDWDGDLDFDKDMDFPHETLDFGWQYLGQ